MRMATQSAALVGLLLIVANAQATCPEFPAFRSKFSKAYASPVDAAAAEAAYCANLKTMRALAAANPLATFAENKFMDIPADKFKQFYRGLKMPSNVTDHLMQSGAVRHPRFSSEEVAAAAQKNCKLGIQRGCDTSEGPVDLWFLLGVLYHGQH